MKNLLDKIKSKSFAIQFAIITAWTAWLAGIAPDKWSLPTNYLLLGVLALFGLYEASSKKIRHNGYDNVWIAAVSVFFSFLIMLAAYSSFAYMDTSIRTLFGLVFIVFFFLSGFCAFKNIFVWLVYLWDMRKNTKLKSKKFSDFTIFLLCFLIIFTVNTAVLLAAYYPGVLTTDSKAQVTQMLNGKYGNHHPYYHTKFMELFIDLGMYVFGNINAAICLYSIVQIALMAAIFAYAVTTVYRMNLPSCCAVGAFLFFAANPINIVYSFTLWKDVLFGGVCLLFVTAVYRVFKNYGNKYLNEAVAAVSALGMCLFRSNGFIAFVISFVLFVVFFGKKHKRLSLAFAIVVFFSYVLKGPMLDAKNISQPDTIESLSIPAQQIARVIKDGHELTSEEYELLNMVVDVDKVAETYSKYISDPIKKLVRAGKNQEYITENAGEYIKLWVKLLVKYPGSYIAAWVDQTVGYWDGGYEYWIMAKGVEGEELGIEETVNIGSVRFLFEEYKDMFTSRTRFPILNVFASIGVLTWVIIGVFAISVFRFERQKAFMAIPCLAIVATLLIATPVFSEFRYAYALLTGLPVITAAFIEK